MRSLAKTNENVDKLIHFPLSVQYMNNGFDIYEHSIILTIHCLTHNVTCVYRHHAFITSSICWLMEMVAVWHLVYTIRRWLFSGLISRTWIPFFPRAFKQMTSWFLVSSETHMLEFLLLLKCSYVDYKNLIWKDFRIQEYHQSNLFVQL